MKHPEQGGSWRDVGVGWGGRMCAGSCCGASWGKKAPNVHKTQKRGCWCKAPVPPCVSPWQLEAGIARHIQELSASNDTREPEDVSAGPVPSCCGMEPSRPPPLPAVPCWMRPPRPPQCPSPLAAVHHPPHEVPGVGAAVSQRASGPGELQKVTGAVPGWGPAAFPWQEHPPRGSGSPRLGAGGSA